LKQQIQRAAMENNVEVQIGLMKPSQYTFMAYFCFRIGQMGVTILILQKALGPLLSITKNWLQQFLPLSLRILATNI
jgi:hypothetical protein